MGRCSAAEHYGRMAHQKKPSWRIIGGIIDKAFTMMDMVYTRADVDRAETEIRKPGQEAELGYSPIYAICMIVIDPLMPMLDCALLTSIDANTKSVDATVNIVVTVAVLLKYPPVDDS